MKKNFGIRLFFLVSLVFFLATSSLIFAEKSWPGLSGSAQAGTCTGQLAGGQGTFSRYTLEMGWGQRLFLQRNFEDCT